MNLSDFATGQRVELHPATDAWMRGDQYGRIVKIGAKYLSIKMERSNRTLRVAPDLIGAVFSHGDKVRL